VLEEPVETLFAEYNILPKRRSIFSGVDYKTKRIALTDVQKLWWGDEEDKVKEVAECLNFLIKYEEFRRNGTDISTTSIGEDSERKAYFKNQLKELI
jgi:hypothetical protein